MGRQGQFKCSFCPHISTQMVHLDEHMRTHTGEKPYKCPTPNCPFAAASISNLRVHQKVHTKEKNILCPLPTCDFRTGHPAALKKHMLIHEGIKPFSCDLCPYRARQKVNIQIHFRKVHTNERPFPCQEEGCAYAAKSKYHLGSHMKTHSEVKSQSCPHCDYKCQQKSALKIHIRIHTGEKPYACQFCEYRAKAMGALRVHIETHTKEKWHKHKCTLCPFSSHSLHSLENHVRTHSGEKPFKCTKCEYTCSQTSNLRSHMTIHDPIKRLKCPHSNCLYMTHQQYRLADHERRIHSNSVATAKTGKGTDRPKVSEGVQVGRLECSVCQFCGMNDKEMALHYMEHGAPLVLLQKL